MLASVNWLTMWKRRWSSTKSFSFKPFCDSTVPKVGSSNWLLTPAKLDLPKWSGNRIITKAEAQIFCRLMQSCAAIILDKTCCGMPRLAASAADSVVPSWREKSRVAWYIAHLKFLALNFLLPTAAISLFEKPVNVSAIPYRPKATQAGQSEGCQARRYFYCAGI